MKKIIAVFFAALSVQAVWATQNRVATRERQYKDYSYPTTQAMGGMMAVGIPAQFGQFCAGAAGMGPQSQGCGPYGFGCGVPAPYPCPGMGCGTPAPMPCPGMGCGGPVAMPGPMPMPLPIPQAPRCLGMCGGGGYMQGGMNMGFNVGAMSADAQMVWATAQGFSNLATFVEPRYFQSRYPSAVVMDPYYRGPRITDHVNRPAQ